MLRIESLTLKSQGTGDKAALRSENGEPMTQEEQTAVEPADINLLDGHNYYCRASLAPVAASLAAAYAAR